MVYEDIYKIFPEIHEIKDKVLQQKSADALISAMEIGGWDGESVYLAPVTMNWSIFVWLLVCAWMTTSI